MGWQLERLGEGACLTREMLNSAIERLARVDRPRLGRLWAYYRNPMRVACGGAGGDSDRPYRQAQEWGLPSRITGIRNFAGSAVFDGEADASIERKEVVIENDIGWRVETIVDYLFGKPVVVRSAAPDPGRREVIDRLVRSILAHNGGLVFMQQLSLLGAVYGFVDVLVKLESSCVEAWKKEGVAPEDLVGMCGGQELGEPPVGSGSGEGSGSSGEGNGSAPVTEETPSAPSMQRREGGASKALADGASARTGAGDRDSLEALVQRLARMIRLEVVEPARAVPFLSPSDYRVVEGYAQVYEIEKKSMNGGPRSRKQGSWWDRLWRNDTARKRDSEQAQVVEIISASRWQKYEDEALVAEGVNALGEVPLVHIQNTAVPFEYAGMSDVEILMPLQDELNTRLSDRAHRITMQSFKMYLGKGIDGFSELAVSPGRMWQSDDPAADVVEFGGDGESPSEIAHIADLREAIDKASGVSPIAAGAIKNRIGRLTSAAALRITLISLLAKTEKKRVTYGTGIQRMVALALAWLDRAGIFHTDPDERRVELHWPSPLPENILEKLQEAEAKARLGVPREVVLRELGY